MNIYGDSDFDTFSLKQGEGMELMTDKRLRDADYALVVVLSDDAKAAKIAEKAIKTLSHEWVFGFEAKVAACPDGGVATFYCDKSIDDDQRCYCPGLYVLDTRSTKPAA